MFDGVAHDVGDVMVGEGIHNLFAAALGRQEPTRSEHPQVLGNKRLADAERLDELVHAVRFMVERFDDGYPVTVRQRTKQLRCCFVAVGG